MPVSLRAASGGFNNTAGTSVAVTLPTGWQAGDWCAVIISINNTTGGFNTLTGWTERADHQNFTSSNFTTLVATRILQAGDANPTFVETASGKYSWCAIALQPGAGETISEDGFSATGENQGDGTTHAAGALIAAAGNVTSVVVNAMRAVNNAATAVTTTPPTNWTEPTNGDQSTNAGTTAALRQVSTSVSYRTDQSGTITPGTSGNNVTTDADCYHFLITSAGAAVVKVPCVASQYASFY